MAERFKHLYRLPSELICDSTPIIIEAGALLLDTNDGSVLAQLKFKNISDKNIKSLSVGIKAFDTAKRPLEGTDDFSYLDLTAKPGDSFGSKKPIYLNDNKTREFVPYVKEVIFADGTIWTSDTENWFAIPERKLLSDALDNEMAKEYLIQLGDTSGTVKFVPEEKFGLVFCPCGEVYNGKKCPSCSESKDFYKEKYNIESLTASMNERLKKEEASRLSSQVQHFREKFIW